MYDMDGCVGVLDFGVFDAIITAPKNAKRRNYDFYLVS